MKKTGIVKRLSSELTGAQRRYLRSLAHSLKPCVIVGCRGCTENVIKQLDIALRDHELVKVKVLKTYEGEESDLIEALTSGTGSAAVQIIGRNVVLYRQNEEEPRIVLPKSSKDDAKSSD